MNDLKFAVRQLLKNPGFTAVAVLTLAVGIGANTAMFSFVNAILLRPLPYADPGRLVMLFENQIAAGRSRIGPGAPVIQEWRNQSTVFEGLGVVRPFGGFTLTGRGQPEVLRGSSVSANVFPLLGIQPLLGRGFLPDEEVLGKNNVVLLSYELWQRRFGGEPGIIGQSLTLDMVPRTVVGVLPPRTAGPDGERDLWSPLAFFPFELLERRAHNFLVFGRLKTNVTPQQARLEMDLVARRMAESNAEDRGWGTEIHPLHKIVVGDSQRLLLVLLGAVSLVLLIGCANIASLLLARSAARTREFAIRAALGAGRRGMIRQLLTESCVLAGGGGALGILLARFGLGIRSFGKLLTQNLGYTAEHLVTLPVSLPRQKYPQQAELVRFFDSLLSATKTIPGVESAGYAFGVPLTGINNSRSVIVRDAPPPAVGETPTAGYAQISPGYFTTMKTPFVQGRDFTERDDTNATPAVIVDETFVKNFRLGDRVIGRQIDIGDGTQGAEIIGVVKGSKNQAPNPKEAPITKLQSPASAIDSLFEIWVLGFIWSLELGIWSFG